MGLLYALITVLAWGTWLAPSQNVPIKDQQTRTFYVTLAAFILALIASIFVGFKGLNATTFWFPFFGGIIWALSGWSAFVGTEGIGMAKAFGIWAPMNIVVGIIWGIVLFGEFMEADTVNLLLAIFAFLIIVAGLIALGRWYLPLIQQNERMRREIHRLEAELEAEQETARQLQAEIDLLTKDPAALEREIRAQMGLAREGETVFRFDGEGTNTAAPLR